MKIRNIFIAGQIFLVISLLNPAFIFAYEETPTMMCDGGVVSVGDKEIDVLQKCGQPNQEGQTRWLYDFGPSQTFIVIFEDEEVVKILEKR